MTIRRISLFIVMVSFAIPSRADPLTYWNVTGFFTDSVTHQTEAITGTIITQVVDFSTQAPYAANGWTYVRQNMVSMQLHGFFRSFTGVGAVDLCDEGTGPHICQVQLVVSDGSRWADPPYNHAFGGTLHIPNALALFDLYPFMGVVGPHTNDRLSLVLMPSTGISTGVSRAAPSVPVH